MSWTDPKTWIPGELVWEGDLNEQIRDNSLVLKTPCEDDGRITALTSTQFANLDGSALTGVAKLAADNAFTDGVHDFSGGAARIVLPVGTNRWATI